MGTDFASGDALQSTLDALDTFPNLMVRHGRPVLEIEDMGDAEALLRNNSKLHEIGQRLIRRGFIPQDDGWAGWLGRYQKALRDAVTTLEIPSVTKQSERNKNRDLGR